MTSVPKVAKQSQVEKPSLNNFFRHSFDFYLWKQLWRSSRELASLEHGPPLRGFFFKQSAGSVWICNAKKKTRAQGPTVRISHLYCRDRSRKRRGERGPAQTPSQPAAWWGAIFCTAPPLRCGAAVPFAPSPYNTRAAASRLQSISNPPFPLSSVLSLLLSGQEGLGGPQPL